MSIELDIVAGRGEVPVIAGHSMRVCQTWNDVLTAIAGDWPIAVEVRREAYTVVTPLCVLKGRLRVEHRSGARYTVRLRDVVAIYPPQKDTA